LLIKFLMERGIEYSTAKDMIKIKRGDYKRHRGDIDRILREISTLQERSEGIKGKRKISSEDRFILLEAVEKLGDIKAEEIIEGEIDKIKGEIAGGVIGDEDISFLLRSLESENEEISNITEKSMNSLLESIEEIPEEAEVKFLLQLLLFPRGFGDRAIELLDEMNSVKVREILDGYDSIRKDEIYQRLVDVSKYLVIRCPHAREISEKLERDGIPSRVEDEFLVISREHYSKELGRELKELSKRIKRGKELTRIEREGPRVENLEELLEIASAADPRYGLFSRAINLLSEIPASPASIADTVLKLRIPHADRVVSSLESKGMGFIFHGTLERALKRIEDEGLKAFRAYWGTGAYFYQGYDPFEAIKFAAEAAISKAKGDPDIHKEVVKGRDEIERMLILLKSIGVVKVSVYGIGKRGIEISPMRGDIKIVGREGEVVVPPELVSSTSLTDGDIDDINPEKNPICEAERSYVLDLKKGHVPSDIDVLEFRGKLRLAEKLIPLPREREVRLYRGTDRYMKFEEQLDREEEIERKRGVVKVNVRRETTEKDELYIFHETIEPVDNKLREWAKKNKKPLFSDWRGIYYMLEGDYKEYTSVKETEEEKEKAGLPKIKEEARLIRAVRERLKEKRVLKARPEVTDDEIRKKIRELRESGKEVTFNTVVDSILTDALVERIDRIEDETLRNLLSDLIRETPGIFVDRESVNFVKRYPELLIPILEMRGFVDDRRLEFYYPIVFIDRVKELIYRLIILGVNSNKKSYQEKAIELSLRFRNVRESEEGT